MPEEHPPDPREHLPEPAALVAVDAARSVSVTDYLTRRYDLDDPRTVSAIDEVSLWSAQFGSLMLDNVEMAAGRTVLDLGCGNGFPLLELAERHGTSCRFVGADVWKAALARAAEKVRTHGLSTVSLVRADGARLPFADASFDLVVSNVGVNNFADPETAMAECGRVTRSGGTIALTTNPRGHMAELYDAYRDVLRATGRAELVPRLDEQEAHRATTDTLGNLLTGGGFAVSRVVESEFPLRFVDGSALLRHPLTVFGFLDGWRSVVPDDDEVEVFTALEESLNGRARERGGLSMRVPMIYLEGRKS